MLNFQPFLAVFAGQKAKPAVTWTELYIHKQTTDCYLANWRLSMASHVGTGLRQEDHPQTSAQRLPGGL